MDADVTSSTGLPQEAPDETLAGADARELLEFAAKYRIAVESGNDPIIMLDDEGKISLWNKAAVRVFGYAAHEALGQDVHALIIPERYRQASAQAFSHFRTTGEGAALGQTRELAGIRKGLSLIHI